MVDVFVCWNTVVSSFEYGQVRILVRDVEFVLMNLDLPSFFLRQ